jgi:23S rRNA (cytidine1920-2'-O)/16S rRNA (cytidine1409-2'-O)-methyltransferase
VKTPKLRLDLALVERGLIATREQAQRAIMAGQVRIGDRVATKASIAVTPDMDLAIAQQPKFVGRGGLKLESALEHFAIDVRGAVALDIGASTGGFTDCLLQRGAAKVYAIDVGHGQLAWKIRNDPRVVVREKLNARFVGHADVPEPIDICVIDVSFISLTLVLPNAFALLSANGVLLALIKPQFELQPHEIGPGGIVTDAQLHEKASGKVRSFIANGGHEIIGLAPSALRGTDGNQEFFICSRKQSG